MPPRRRNRRKNRRGPQAPSLPMMNSPRSIVDSDAESLSDDCQIIDDYISNLEANAGNESSSDEVEFVAEFSSPTVPQEPIFMIDPDNLDDTALAMYQAFETKQSTYKCPPSNSKVRLAHHRIGELLGAQTRSLEREPHRYVEVMFADGIEITSANGVALNHDTFLNDAREIATELGLRRKLPSKPPELFGQKNSSKKANDNVESWDNEGGNTNQSKGRKDGGSSRGKRRKKKQGESADAQPASKPLGADNWGFAMLQKMGWTEGQGLGAGGSGIKEPLQVTKRKGRKGLRGST